MYGGMFGDDTLFLLTREQKYVFKGGVGVERVAARTFSIFSARTLRQFTIYTSIIVS